MDDSKYSKNIEAKKIVGLRNDGKPFQPIDEPCELGYACPICHKNCRLCEKNELHLEETLYWSEYDGFLWCSVCNLDIPSFLCYRANTKERAKHMTVVFLDFAVSMK